jgi:NAD(P)-dependent dehydrogenase (short-subunit alcohol dehydrogenase family)
VTDFLGMKEPITAVVVGARGGVGAAFCRRFEREPSVRAIHGTSRDAQWSAEPGPGKLRKHCLDIVDEDSVRRLAEVLRTEGEAPNLVINCTGLLHGDGLGPERTWRELDIDTMRRVFDVNALGVALLVKHLVPLMPRAERSFFATLSARVGSIGDNRLGGWYSYRASKAAQNMLVKTASIEAKRQRRKLVLVALHPGTVDSDLSKPFTTRYEPDRLFTPDFSCERLCEVLSGLGAEDSGGLYAWDGVAIPW